MPGERGSWRFTFARRAKDGKAGSRLVPTFHCGSSGTPPDLPLAWHRHTARLPLPSPRPPRTVCCNATPPPPHTPPPYIDVACTGDIDTWRRTPPSVGEHRCHLPPANAARLPPSPAGILLHRIVLRCTVVCWPRACRFDNTRLTGATTQIHLRCLHHHPAVDCLPLPCVGVLVGWTHIAIGRGLDARVLPHLHTFPFCSHTWVRTPTYRMTTTH